jgi:hypothetical protein
LAERLKDTRAMHTILELFASFTLDNAEMVNATLDHELIERVV